MEAIERQDKDEVVLTLRRDKSGVLYVCRSDHQGMEPVPFARISRWWPAAPGPQFDLEMFQGATKRTFPGQPTPRLYSPVPGRFASEEDSIEFLKGQFSGKLVRVVTEAQ